MQKLIERKARETATQIVMRTSASMKLEDHENRQERLEAAIREKTAQLIDEMPRFIWDQY
ncbi:hypothetical protein [Pedobacter yulinensis]|nr:hypothetical protein [Pedobacter yulinensis]